MNAVALWRRALLNTTAAALCLTGIANPIRLAAQDQNQDQEVQMGQEVFNELKAKGEIIESSPLYDQLKPIADAITRSAQPRYNHPFKFYLVHEPQPNAFATPGGNVYVVDSLLYFVKNTDQLAGTLCHEVSHTIHHDTVTLMEKQERLEKREVGAAILLGPTRAHVLAILLLGKLHSLSYSRDVESRADLTGSDVCAATGYNPWGLVWLFQDFDNAKMGQVPQLLSDHPGNQTRIDALEEHFRDNPSVFAKFNPDPKSASPFVVPKNVLVGFSALIQTCWQSGRKPNDASSKKLKEKTQMTTVADLFAAGLEQVRKSWGWFLVSGIALMILGVVCVGKAQTATTFSILALGWILAISAVFWLVSSFYAFNWQGFFLYLLNALIRGVTGYLLIRHPDAGAEGVTMVLAVLFIVGGIFRASASGTIQFPRWGWTLFAGLVSVSLGVYLLATFPAASTYFVGLAIGIDLIFDGGSLVGFAGAIHSLPSVQTRVAA